MDNFCAFPFHHVAIHSNGDYNICCQHRIPPEAVMNSKTQGIDQWLQSPYLKQVQQDFKQNVRNPGCSSCWGHDDKNMISMRQRTKKEFSILGIDTNNPTIKYAEIDVGNLCNLKCLMCDERQSSAILAENKRLGVNLIDQKDVTWNQSAFDNVRQLIALRPRVLNIRGGEPFYNKDLLELIKKIPDDQADQTLLHVTTNATMWNDSWHEALSRYRSIRIMFSVDATDQLYEYIRYPACWAHTQSQIKKIKTLPNVRSMIHSVVQNLNIARLGDLIEWSMQENIYLELDLLWKPNFLQIHNLPDDMKKIALEHLKTLMPRSYPQHIIDFLHKCEQVLSSHENHDPELWQKFKDHIEPRDRLRGNSYTKFLGTDSA